MPICEPALPEIFCCRVNKGFCLRSIRELLAGDQPVYRLGRLNSFVVIKRLADAVVIRSRGTAVLRSIFLSVGIVGRPIVDWAGGWQLSQFRMIGCRRSCRHCGRPERSRTEIALFDTWSNSCCLLLGRVSMSNACFPDFPFAARSVLCGASLLWLAGPGGTIEAWRSTLR